ncbi:peptidylprolyl isomerase [Sungkyunkwania multivorans]|uniref:Peptidyl-prolyl cis-trans isomerase n=1 Tax=Sungkyunkwania multivorans TaxID=1173618 RepID=A0ABW3CSU0_9FLAO
MRIFSLYTILPLFFLIACKDTPETKTPPAEETIPEEVNKVVMDSVFTEAPEEEEAPFKLTDENAIPFFNQYEKDNPETKVRITTKFGSFDIELFENVPYHRANFIYLTKKGYFNGTYFHRVVNDFIIQGGNSDSRRTSKKRNEIGRYLLPPDTRKGHRHHRGVVSVPSSDIDNPHKLASPFEFFIVQKKDGAYHLDGGYTAFGSVVRGMDVVDKIAAQPTDVAEWPLQDISMQVEVIE